MEEYNRSKSYGNENMQMEKYYPPTQKQQQQQQPQPSYDLRCYSASYAQSQMSSYNNGRDFKPKKGINGSGSSSSSKPWGLTDPEFQRKKRVASYKMYSVEGKVKGSFRKSFRWLKERYSQAVYGWW